MFRTASTLPVDIYNELKDLLESYGANGKAFNRNSFEKLLKTQRPSSWENLSEDDKKTSFDSIYKHIYDILYPKTKGQYQKGYIQEKYESGEVQEWEIQEKDLMIRTEEASKDLESLIQKETDNLKAYLEEVKGMSKKASEDDIQYVNQRAKNFYDSLLEDITGETLDELDKHIYNEESERFEGFVEYHDKQRVIGLYRNIYFGLPDEMKSTQQKEETEIIQETEELTKDIDQKIENETNKEIIKNDDELTSNEKIEIIQRDSFEAKVEQKVEEIKEEEITKKVYDEVKETPVLKNEDYRDEEYRIMLWIAKKEGISIEDVLGDLEDKDFDLKLLRFRSPDKSPKFKNILKTLSYNKFKSEDSNDKLNFYQVLNYQSKPYYASIIKDAIDLSTLTEYNWIEKDFYNTYYNWDLETLTDYYQALYDVLSNEIEFISTAEREESKENSKQEHLEYKELKESLDKKVNLSILKTYLPNLQMRLQSLESGGGDYTAIQSIQKSIAETKLVTKLIQDVEEKLKKNKDLPLKDRKDLSKIECYIAGRLEQEKLAEAKKLQRNDPAKLDEQHKELLKVDAENKIDKQDNLKEELKNNPEGMLAVLDQELKDAKTRKTKNYPLTELQKELLATEQKIKLEEKAKAPLNDLAQFKIKCRTNKTLMAFLEKTLCKGKVKDYDLYENKVLHEIYSIVVNAGDENITTKNYGRIRFILKEAIRDCILRDKRESLYKAFGKTKGVETSEENLVRSEKGLTILDYLPSNLVVDVDDDGMISKLTSLYDNKLSNLNDKIDIQENLVEKFDLVKNKIYKDLKEVVSGDPATDSGSYLAFKNKLLALIAAIALETGLRPAPSKSEPDPGEEARGGQSYKMVLQNGETSGEVKTDEEGRAIVLENQQKKKFVKELVDTYGIATLLPEHIKFFDKNIKASLKFIGKKGTVNASSVSQQELIKELHILVAAASGKPRGQQSLFVLPNGKRISNTDIVVYFESLTKKAGLKKLRITDFRKFKAVSVIHASLLEQQKSLYRKIAELRTVEVEKAKVQIAEEVLKVVDTAYRNAQKALSHSKVDETINSYINPNLLLNFLSSGGVEDAIENGLKSKTKLQFDPEVFMIQALAYNGVDVEKIEKYKFFEGKKDESLLQSTWGWVENKFTSIVKAITGA